MTMRQTLAQRYGSPRTLERPMGFTAGEFVRGAIISWVGFNLAAPVTLANYALITGLFAGGPMALGSFVQGVVPVLFLSPIVLVPWSGGALVAAGAPLALVIGLALRRSPSPAVHLTSFTVLGAVVGVATTCVYALSFHTQGLQNLVLIVLMGATTAGAVGFGWWRTSSLALRDDAERMRAGTDAQRAASVHRRAAGDEHGALHGDDETMGE